MVQKSEEKNYLEDLGVNRTVILKRILMKQDGARGRGLDSSSSGQGKVACSCERGNETSGLKQFWELLDSLGY